MWLITGAGGQLGSVLLQQLHTAGVDVLGTVSPKGPRPHTGRTIAIDLTDSAQVTAQIAKLNPTMVIHTAAVTSVAAAYDDPDYARRVNVEATANLAQAAQNHGARFVFTSTDLVFDGTNAPYDEAAEPQPTSIYGNTKWEAEERLLALSNIAIVRLPLMVGIPAVNRRSTFQDQLQAVRNGKTLQLFQDEFRTPIDLEDAAAACIEIAKSDVAGILHAGGPERLSRVDIGSKIATALDINSNFIRPIMQTDLRFPEARPADVSLDSSRFERLFGHPAGRGLDITLSALAEKLNGIISQ